jgi:tetratricopeptide (TPR) repeat protein
VENVSNRRIECHKTLLVVRGSSPIFVTTQNEHGARAIGGRVFDSENKLRHLPFFDEIATVEESEPSYRSATAGLVVLRLVDAWLEDGPHTSVDDDWGLLAIHNAIEAVDDGTPIKTLLGRVVESLRSARPDIHLVTTPLMAYGQALEYEAKWQLAADVYRTVLAHLHPVQDSDSSVAAYLRLGQCYRHLSEALPASDAFRMASEIATAANDMVGTLRARIGEAQVAIIRGNMPIAEALLDDTIREAVGPQLRDVRSRALHDRATVAYFRREYEFSIQLAYDALAISESPSERDRILSDIGVSFMELGVYTAARDAYLVLSVTAQEQFMRWGATMNLLEIAYRTGIETHFELYRRQLTGQKLPPLMATAFELNVGSGYRAFGDFEKARHHLQTALTMATSHGFNQYLFEAEEALLQLERPTPRTVRVQDISLDTEEVANAIRELREAAGV